MSPHAFRVASVLIATARAKPKFDQFLTAEINRYAALVKSSVARLSSR